MGVRVKLADLLSNLMAMWRKRGMMNKALQAERRRRMKLSITLESQDEISIKTGDRANDPGGVTSPVLPDQNRTAE
jgi:hypothetical protein